MNTHVPPPPSNRLLDLSEVAVASARQQFGRQKDDWEFPIYFLGDEEELCQYCIDAFLIDRQNVGSYSIMSQAMMQAPNDLRAAIVASYRAQT